MVFELVHQIPCPTQTAKNYTAVRTEFMNAVMDYLWDVFYPSIGYQVIDVPSPPTGYVNGAKEIIFPVINAANNLDYSMKLLQGWLVATSGIYQFVQINHRARSISGANANNDTGTLGIARAPDPAKLSNYFERQRLFKPAKIYQDKERPSDWFLVLFDRIMMCYIKPRIKIDDIVDAYKTDPNRNYATQIGFYSNTTNYSFGGKSVQFEGGAGQRIYTNVPTDAVPPTGGHVLFKDLAFNAYQNNESGDIGSVNSKNFGLFMLPERYFNGNALFTSFAFSSVGRGDLFDYWKLQDSTGNWWILSNIDLSTTTYHASWGFNCGQVEPV